MNAPANLTDASLKTVTVTPGKLAPTFWGERTQHAVLLTSDQDSAILTATAAQPGATLKFNGQPITSGQPAPAGKANVGKTLHIIEVTAADGVTKKSYEFKFLRSQPLRDWKRLLEHAPFTARDSAGEITHNGQMFVLGGYIPELVNDVWASRNGVDWTQVGNIPNEAGVNIPVAFSYGGKMFITTNDGKLYSSPEGKSWSLVNELPPFGKRYGAGSAVFAGKMWVAGGAGGIDAKGSALRNDVWSSTDGVNWKLELAHAPWSPRQLFGNLVAHNGKLFAIGGGVTSYQPFRAYNDVWSSPDGVNWSLETDNAGFDPRIWSSVLSYHGRLWLLGGFEAMPRWKNFNDVWYSADGKTWKHFATENIWSERHEVSPFVHDGKLWLVAGNAWPLVNDVWCLKLDKLEFITQPLIEEYSAARYRYLSAADFNASATPVQYRLITGPAWLSMNTQSGLLSGNVPEDAAGQEFNIEIEARDQSGETAKQQFTLSILP